MNIYEEKHQFKSLQKLSRTLNLRSTLQVRVCIQQRY